MALRPELGIPNAALHSGSAVTAAMLATIITSPADCVKVSSRSVKALPTAGRARYGCTMPAKLISRPECKSTPHTTGTSAQPLSTSTETQASLASSAAPLCASPARRPAPQLRGRCTKACCFSWANRASPRRNPKLFRPLKCSVAAGAQRLENRAARLLDCHLGADPGESYGALWVEARTRRRTFVTANQRTVQ